MSFESENSKKLQDFFHREYRTLKAYVNSRIRDTANRNAEDLIQDVALKLFTSADRYAPINNVAGFVYRSIRNKIIDVMRTTKQIDRMIDDQELTDLETLLQQTTNEYTSESMIMILKKSIDQLKPVYRDIIIAVDYEGYTYKEIAAATGIPEGTLMSRRHRALNKLHKTLTEEFNTYKNNIS